MESLEDLGSYIKLSLPNDVSSFFVDRNELTVQVYRNSIVRVLSFLRDNKKCLYKQLLDVCGVDYPSRQERFDVVYHLLSLNYNQRVRVILSAREGVPVPTATDLFSSANWWEREVWDMFGIIFKGHPDMRRILTDYNFEGYPLRKDFPVTGYTEVTYDSDLKKVVYKPVSLETQFRSFDFLSPWESMTEEMKKKVFDESLEPVEKRDFKKHMVDK